MFTHKLSMKSQLHAYVNPQADLRRKNATLLKLNVNNPEQTFTTGTGIPDLLHVDYWAYTTKRQLLQLHIKLVFGFNISLLVPKPGLIFKLFVKNISFKTVLTHKRKLAPPSSF